MDFAAASLWSTDSPAYTEEATGPHFTAMTHTAYPSQTAIITHANRLHFIKIYSTWNIKTAVSTLITVYSLSKYL